MFHYRFAAPGRKISLPFGTNKYKCVVLAEQKIEQELRREVSSMLVETGCLYMMAWGIECSLWDDSVDEANMAEFNFGTIPEDRFVMTTWHPDETLEDVLHFAKYNARLSFSGKSLDTLLVLDFGMSDRAQLIERAYLEC